jgi:DNA-binding response OmpR family regulator
VPVIMLTARDEDFDQVLGLNSGPMITPTKPGPPARVCSGHKTLSCAA